MLKTEDSKDELINYLSGSYCISHVMNERLGWCACATERIIPRDDSFFSSHIKDSFKMNESFKNDPSRLVMYVMRWLSHLEVTSAVNTGMRRKQNHRAKYRSEDGCERLSQIM